MSKTWFITGASSGFGRELTQLLLKRGDRVAATVRRPDALRDLAGEYGDRLWVGILDVTDGMAVRNVVDRAFAELKRINVVVSNAGYALSARPRRSRMPRSSARSTQTCSVRSMWPAPQFPTTQPGRRPHHPDLVLGRPGGLSHNGRLCRDQMGY
jgi:NAD(P)-dependent dehydrogenase (short-subunit alcohol dehydrogenase family)